MPIYIYVSQQDMMTIYGIFRHAKATPELLQFTWETDFKSYCFYFGAREGKIRTIVWKKKH